MRLSDIKSALQNATSVTFQLPDGTFVPSHCHITEVGTIAKHFIDCGGIVRQERRVTFQLWDAADTNHRLAPQKLLHIIALSERRLNIEDLEVEVEYQGTNTIGKYGLTFNGQYFLLTGIHTACLATNTCGTTQTKQIVSLAALPTKSAGCTPGGGCC